MAGLSPIAANSAPLAGIDDGSADGATVGPGDGACAATCKIEKQNAAHNVAAFAEKDFMADAPVKISASIPAPVSPPAALLEPFVPGTALRN